MRQAEGVGGAEGAASDDLRKSKVAVLFPVPVARKIGQRAEAHLAPSQRVQRLLTLQKSAELTADGTHCPQHTVIGFEDVTAGKGKHADYFVIGSDRKDTGAVLAGFGRQSRRGHGASRTVEDPERLA